MKRLTALKVLTGTLVLVLLASAYPLAHLVVTHLESDATGASAGSGDSVPSGSHQLPFDPDGLGTGTGDSSSPTDGATAGDGPSSRPTPGTSSSSTGSALLDQVLGSARLLGHDLVVPDLPLAKLAPENPLRHALLAWIAATGADVPATELARELARADALPVDLQRDLAILILSASEATILQNQALSTISAEDLAWIQSNPQVAQDLVDGVNSPDTLRLSTLAAQVDITKSLQATLLMLEAVEVTRGRLSDYELDQVGSAMETLELDPHTRALFEHLAAGAGPTDADKVRFAADLVALSTGLELDRSPLPKIPFQTGLEHLLAATSQPADAAALAQVLRRAELLPTDLNEALGTLLAAQAGAISASNPAVATPELQAQALVDVLEAAAQALPALEKYHHYWTGAPDAMRVGQWDAESRYKWTANHAGLFASAGTSPSTIARVVGSHLSGAIPVADVPDRSFVDALDAYLRLDGRALTEEDRTQLADITSWIEPVALDAGGILLSGAAEASRLDREAWAALSAEERAFLFATTELVAQLYVKEGLTAEELEILAHHTMLSQRVDGAKIAQAGAVATLAAERAAQLIGQGETMTVQQEAVTLRTTGWRAFLSSLMPIGSARAQAAPPTCVPLVSVVPNGGESFLYSNDCDRDVLLRITDFNGEDGVNADIFVLTGRADSTQLPPTGIVDETCQGSDCMQRVQQGECHFDSMGMTTTIECPKEVYLLGGSKVHLDLGGTDTYNMPVATTTPTQYRDRGLCSGDGCFISLMDIFGSLGNLGARIPAGQVSLHVDAGGGDNYYDATALYEDHPDFESYYGKFQDHPTQGSAYGGGVALLYDNAGGDFYQGGDRSQGYGRWGFGALVDTASGDTYVGGKFVQGAGSEMLNAGIGLLLDVEGGDKYEAERGQGFGLGGVLLDLSGTDRYEQSDAPLGIPAVRLDIIPGGDVTNVEQRGDGRLWLDGPSPLNVGIGMDQELSKDADKDTDDDRFPDSLEKFLGSDHENRTHTPVQAAENRTAEALDDSDGDGWSDSLERVLSTDPENKTEFPAHVPRDVGKNLPPQAGGGVASQSGDKIIDLRLPLQDAGRIEKACASRQINGTALYTPRNIWTNNEPGGLTSTSPLSFNESTADHSSMCISIAYETTGEGQGNGTLPGLPAYHFEYDLPRGILAIGDTVGTTYDIDYYFALDMGGADKFLNGAGGALPVIFTHGANRDTWKPTQAFAPSFALSIDRESGDAGKDLYAPPADSDRVHHAQGSLLGVLIDTNGNDRYIAGDASQGSKGGILLDLAGADNYTAGNLAQGAGFAQDPNRAELGAGLEGGAERTPGQDEGVRRTAPGLLADFGAGADTYEAQAHSQGAARGYSQSCSPPCDQVGELAPYSTGILYDEKGNDKYRAQLNSQGVGSARATGLLFDAAGEDKYLALGRVSQGATISRSYLQPAGSTTFHHPAIGALVDIGGTQDTYEWTDGAATHSRTEQRQDQITVSKGDATPGDTPAGWEVDSDRGIHVDTTQATFAGTLAGTGAEDPFFTDGRDLSDEDDEDVDKDGDVDSVADADVFLVNMPNARLAIGDAKPTHYTHEYAFVVDLGGNNQYNFTAAGFIGDLVARGPVHPNVRPYTQEHPVATLFPVTFVFDAGKDESASTYRTDRSFSQGAGFFSVGILVDQAGPDTFLVQPARLPSLGSGWMSAAIIPDGNIGGTEWAGAHVESRAFVGQRDARFSKNATVRIGNDHDNLYIAIEIPLNNTAANRDTLSIHLDTGHDRRAGRDENNRTGLDVAFVAANACDKPLDRHAINTAGTIQTDQLFNADDVHDLKVGCGERDGRRIYELVKPLRATFPADHNDVVIGFDKTIGLLETRLGLRLAVVEDVEHSTPASFVWPAGTTATDGALGYRQDADLTDEMRDWAALTLANAGKSANATNVSRLSPMAQGAGVGGIGLLAHLASDNSSATFIASERSQGYGAYGGIGMIFDGGSGDTYVGDRLVQAAAEAYGVGILVDAEGNDRYLGTVQSGGYANQNGAYAFFSDTSGVDEYAVSGARPNLVNNPSFETGTLSPEWMTRSVAANPTDDEKRITIAEVRAGSSDGYTPSDGVYYAYLNHSHAGSGVIEQKGLDVIAGHVYQIGATVRMSDDYARGKAAHERFTMTASWKDSIGVTIKTDTIFWQGADTGSFVAKNKEFSAPNDAVKLDLSVGFQNSMGTARVDSVVVRESDFNEIETDRVFDSDFNKRFPPGNQRVWFQGAGGFGVDQNSPDKQSEVVRDYAARFLLDATSVDFEVRQVTPEGECSGTLVPQNPAGSTPRFVVRGEVCLFARVHLPDRGVTVTTESLDFLIDGIRVNLPVVRPSTLSDSHVDFTMLLDASYLEDGIHTLGAIARMRAADQASVLLYTVPAPDLSVQVSNAPVVQVDLQGQPGYRGATDAAFSPLAVTGPRNLDVAWTVSHDADEDRLELFQGWTAPPELRNVPCADDERRLCNSLPFFILDDQGRLDSQPGQKLAASPSAEARGGSSLIGKTTPLHTHVDLAKDDTFYLHISDRWALQPQPLTTVVTFTVVDSTGRTVLAKGEFTKLNPPGPDPADMFGIAQPASARSPTATFDALCKSLPSCTNFRPSAYASAPASTGARSVSTDNWTNFVLDLEVENLQGQPWAHVGEDSVRIDGDPSRYLLMEWSVKGAENSPVVDAALKATGDPTPIPEGQNETVPEPGVNDPAPGANKAVNDTLKEPRYTIKTTGGGMEKLVTNGFSSFFSYGTADAPTRFEMLTPTEPSTRAEILLQRIDDPETTYTLQSPTLVEGDSEGTPAVCSARRCTQFVTPFTGALSGVDLPDGAYRAFVNATDASGLNTAVNQTFLLDRTLPTSRVTTHSNVGRVLLVNGLIPVTWDVSETGEGASGLHQTYLYSRPVAEGAQWKLEGVYPESVRQALFSPSKDVSLSYDFLTIAEDRVGNLERLPAADGQELRVDDALVEKEKLGLSTFGYQRVTIDEAVPLVNNPRIEGGRALNYKGSDVVFVRANEGIAFKVSAADDAEGTGIGRVDIAFVYVDPVTGSILSHERNLCDGNCASGEFAYTKWSEESHKKDIFPDGIWAVLFDVYDAGSNLVRVNVGNVLLDTGSPTLEVEPVVYPPSKAAAALGDRVSLRVRGFDAFGVDFSSLSADVSAISTEGTVTFRPLRVDGVIYQEANFIVDREDVESGLYDVTVSLRDNAGNPVSEVLDVAVDVSTFDILPSTIVITDVTHDSFTVTWNTTEPTNAYVKYGTGLLKSKTPTGQDYTTTHEVVVTGLDSSTGYNFRVVSATPGGYTTESDTLTVTTQRALYLTGLSPEAGDAVSGIVPVRFEGGVLGADGLVTYTLEAKSAGGNYSFVTTASRRGDLHELNFNSSRYLDAANYTLRITGEYGRETLSVELGPFMSDNTPPTIEVLSPKQATNLTRPEIRAEVRDNLAGFATNAIQLVIDGKLMAGVSTAPIADETNAFAVRYGVQDELDAGVHKFQLTAVDKAGNKWVESWNVTVDGDAPVLTPNLARYDPGPGAGKLGGAVTLNVTVEDAGGIRSVVANTSAVSAQSATLLFRQTGTDHFIGTFELTVEELEAVRTVRVVATDLAGNEGSTFAEVIVDNAPPEANEFVTVTTGHTTATVRTTSEEPVLLVGRASAPRSPAVLAETVDLATEARLTFTGLLPSRSYEYTVTVLDRAGNSIQRSGTFQTTQDSTPPGEIDGLTVTDLLNGTLRLTWRAAQDDIGVAKYRVYRSDDGVNYVPVAEVSDTIYEDSGLPYERNYLYHVVAVDHGGNEGTPIDAVHASATALPRLDAGDVTPAVGSVSTTFKYTIRYVSPGGVAPAYVRIILDGVPQDMTLVGEPDYADGALYEYATRLSPHTRGEPHTYTFEASDGRYTVRFPDAEPVRGPLVSADANADGGSAGLANFAQNVPLGGTVGALAGMMLAALAVALLIRKKKEGSK